MALAAVPALITLAGGTIKLLLGYAITRFFLAIGVGYVTYIGMDTLLENFRTELEARFGELPGTVLDIMALSGADVGLSILFSAISIRLLYVGFVGGAKTALRMKGID